MSSAENYVLGMDCGTTNIKAVILGDDGKVMAEASLPSRFIEPGVDMHEQDAGEWWENSKKIFRMLKEKAGQEIIGRLRGIAISSHTVSLLALDEAGRPLRNAMTYQDGRSVKELEYILDKIGFDRYVRIVGGQPSTAFLPNKILWFKNHEPELFAKTRYFIQASSYINYRLTGVMTTDLDQATKTQCLDITSLEWSKDIGDVIGVDLDRMMPPVKLSDEIIGEVTREASEETGLPAGIPVVAGCSDAMAAMYAMGLSRLGDAGESSGTSSLIFVTSAKKSAPDVPVVTRPCTLEGVPWIFDAPITSTGIALKWYIEKLAAEERIWAEQQKMNIYTYLNQLALTAKPGCGGLFFFPYLMGERAPLWNNHAKGMFIGLRMDTARNEMIRSVFEGTAYAIRHVLETIGESGAKAEVLRICGGGAKSRAWSQIKASVLNMPVEVLDETSGDVPVGDAMIAGKVAGLFSDSEDAAKKVVRIRETIGPDPAWVKAYDELYPYYVRMYRCLDGELKSLKETLETL